MEHGGKRTGAGRKTMVDELTLIEQLHSYINPGTFAKELENLISISTGKLKLDALNCMLNIGSANQKIQ